MAYLGAVIVGLVFGAVDQYLGTIRFGPWAWTVSGMSAPWLVIVLFRRSRETVHPPSQTA